MKELSIEEKAKRYDEALEKARQLCAYPTTKPFINDLQDLFPELAESEDEKTRKRIIALVNAHGQGIYKGDMLAWLENIPYTIDHEKREGFHLGYKVALEKQGETFTKKDVDDAYVEGMAFAKNELEKQGEQESAWSEEDENRINRLIAYFEDKESFTSEDDIVYANWLKSLKQRIGGEQ